MSFSEAFQEQLFDLLLNNQTLATIGDATGIVGSTGDGSLYVSLHSGDPGETGTQTTNELTTGEYTGYARVAIARDDAARWTISTSGSPSTASNAAATTFPACTGGTGVTATYFVVGAESGTTAGIILWSGALDSGLAISNGITPEFAIGDLELTLQ